MLDVVMSCSLSLMCWSSESGTAAVSSESSYASERGGGVAGYGSRKWAWR